MSNVTWTDDKLTPWKRGDKPHKDFPDRSNPVVGTCPQCGIELRQMMHYCCMQAHCPSGLGGTYC